jgi:hypothetical protein
VHLVGVIKLCLTRKSKLLSITRVRTTEQDTLFSAVFKPNDKIRRGTCRRVSRILERKYKFCHLTIYTAINDRHTLCLEVSHFQLTRVIKSPTSSSGDKRTLCRSKVSSRSVIAHRCDSCSYIYIYIYIRIHTYIPHRNVSRNNYEFLVNCYKKRSFKIWDLKCLNVWDQVPWGQKFRTRSVEGKSHVAKASIQLLNADGFPFCKAMVTKRATCFKD